MPHPTPTAATKAPPLPLRGEGMGVGGRPGPARRVRIHAAPGLAPLLALLLASPATAQIIPTGTPAADILLSQAISEHRIFLTCSALDATTHQRITENWQRDVTAAAAILTANQVPAEAITAFTTAARAENLIPAPDTPWAEVQGLCATNPDWQAAYVQMNLTILDLKLPGAFP